MSKTAHKRTVPDRVRALVRRAPRPEPLVLVVLLVLSACTWAFIEIADEVGEGDSRGFDHWLITQFREQADPADPIGPDWLEAAFLDLTALGGYTVLTLVVLAVAGFMFVAGRRTATWLVLIASAGGATLAHVLKLAFGRPRPDVVIHLVEVRSLSFPSGHALMSTVIYLTLGVLVAQVATRWSLRIYALCAALLLAFLVGLSRVVLGVHYPTDVLAGWSAGLAWALLCWMALRWWQRRRADDDAPALGPIDKGG